MKKHLIVLAALTFFPVFSPGHASTNFGGGDNCGSGHLQLGGGDTCGGGLRAFGEGGSGCGNGARPSLR